MTVQGVAGPRWLLRLLLVVGLGLLVAVLTALWWAPSAHATPDTGDATAAALAPVTDLVGDAVTSGATEAVGDVVTTATDTVAPVAESVTTRTVAPVVETFAAPVAETVVPVAEPVVAPVAEVVAPVAETVAPVAEAVAAPVAEVVAPVAETPAAPVAEAVGPVVDVLTPVAEAVTPVVAPVAGAATTAAGALVPLTDALGPVTGALTAPSSPVLDVLRPVLSLQGGGRGATAVPVVPDAAALPCPTVAAPVVPTVRPSSPWQPGAAHDSGPRPDDRLPVVVPPPSVEHVRSSTSDHPRPTGGPATGLSMTTAGTASGGRAGADGDLPADLEPPQLRVLSTRAGPGAGPATAPQIEILDSPA